MQNNLSIRAYGQYNAPVKQFSFIVGGEIRLVKPKEGESFYMHEDFLGDRSSIWIVCLTEEGEQWRHKADNVHRITFNQSINLPYKKECEVAAQSDTMFLQWSEVLESFLKSLNIPFLTSDADVVAFKFGSGSDDNKVAFGMQFQRYCDGIAERVIEQARNYEKP